MAADKPSIRIVNHTGMAHDTQVFLEDGTEITGAITELDVHMKAGEVNTASLKTILVGGEIDAVIEALGVKVLPPPEPRTQIRLRVEAPVDAGSRYILERIVPLVGHGVKEEFLAEGWMDPVGPLEIIGDAPE